MLVDAVLAFVAGSVAIPAAIARSRCRSSIPLTVTLYVGPDPVTVTTFVPPAVPAITTSVLAKPITGSENTTVKLIGVVFVGSS